MDSRAVWLNELEHPTGEFFAAFARRVREAGGARGAAREAVLHLAPRVDLGGWPHGLLGLGAVLGLEEHLSESAFLRLLATQLHACVQEARLDPCSATPREEPGDGDFARLLLLVAGDMANVGHKAVMVCRLGELASRLGCPGALLPLAARVAAAPPSDRSWNALVRRRLGGSQIPVAPGPADLDPERHREGAREICDLGMLAMLDAFTARMKAGAHEGDLLTTLVLAASEKQLDARPDLEAGTSWNFVYLAILPALGASEAWGQAAAMVNFFPSEEPEDRLQAETPLAPTDPGAALLEAILDGESGLALGLLPILRTRCGDAGVLRVLAEAVSVNDPIFNRSHQVLALAAALELLPRINESAKGPLLQALAKFLACSQGSGELGRMAEKTLGG